MTLQFQKVEAWLISWGMSIVLTSSHLKEVQLCKSGVRDELEALPGVMISPL